jgi:hypothetical protein
MSIITRWNKQYFDFFCCNHRKEIQYKQILYNIDKLTLFFTILKSQLQNQGLISWFEQRENQKGKIENLGKS